MLSSIRRAILALNARGESRAAAETLRRLIGVAAKLVRNPDRVDEHLDGFNSIIEQHQAEVSTWVQPESLTAGIGGPFDACDLRHWLIIAGRAGVPFVPAKPILSLTEDEMSAGSGTVKLPDNATTRGIRRRAENIPAFADQPPDEASEQVDIEALEEKLHQALDEVPEGWMVRFARCGSSELKALAGIGVAGPKAPEVRFGPDLEVGPGWVRIGNRRRVRISDSRTVEAYAQGPGGPAVFLARPWVEAARWFVSEDPHRHGTPYAGKGCWPAEWRAFVEDGVVIGVSSYYGWCTGPSPENARAALEVRTLAQKMVDEAVALKAYPRYMDIEFTRLIENPRVKEDAFIQSHLALFGREKVACTLDFIETKAGIAFLEGGPAHSAFGGGHPCAFAGVGGKVLLHKNHATTKGVAFRVMPHVILGAPKTWDDGDRAGCVLDWLEVEQLAKIEG